MSIPSGSNLWNVYGWDAPEEIGGTEHLIGKLVSTSETVKSKYGDEHLYIRHQKAEEDIALKPEWKDHYVKYSGLLNHNDGECDYEIDENREMQSNCPFAFLLQF